MHQSTKPSWESAQPLRSNVPAAPTMRRPRHKRNTGQDLARNLAQRRNPMRLNGCAPPAARHRARDQCYARHATATRDTLRKRAMQLGRAAQLGRAVQLGRAAPPWHCAGAPATPPSDVPRLGRPMAALTAQRMRACGVHVLWLPGSGSLGGPAGESQATTMAHPGHPATPATRLRMD